MDYKYFKIIYMVSSIMTLLKQPLDIYLILNNYSPIAIWRETIIK